MIKANIDGKEIELKPEDLQLGDGYGLITPDKVPSGYFTQDAFDKKIGEITKIKVDKAKDELKSDEDFKKSVLSDFNISLDDNGNPKGLKPDFDPDKWKQEQAKKLTEPYEEKLKTAEQKLGQFKQGLVRAELLKSANGLFQEQYTKSFTGSDDPFVVKQFADQFDVDDDGNVARKDPQGGFEIVGDGKKVTPSVFFDQNKDKFADLLKDNRQRSSGTSAGGSNGQNFTREQVSKMSDEEYSKNREAIQKATSEGRIK